MIKRHGGPKEYSEQWREVEAFARFRDEQEKNRAELPEELKLHPLSENTRKLLEMGKHETEGRMEVPNNEELMNAINAIIRWAKSQ